MVVSIADPLNHDALLRLAVVDKVYRLPTSNPAISAAIAEADAENKEHLHDLELVLDNMLTELQGINFQLSLITGFDK